MADGWNRTIRTSCVSLTLITVCSLCDGRRALLHLVAEVTEQVCVYSLCGQLRIRSVGLLTATSAAEARGWSRDCLRNVSLSAIFLGKCLEYSVRISLACDTPCFSTVCDAVSTAFKTALKTVTNLLLLASSLQIPSTCS